jgi:putative tryptophan/tyrosine transport system substrate-binding protein
LLGRASDGRGQPPIIRSKGEYLGSVAGADRKELRPWPSSSSVVQSTKFEYVIDLKTAKALGIEAPISMQLLADEVIE